MFSIAFNVIIESGNSIVSVNANFDSSNELFVKYAVVFKLPEEILYSILKTPSEFSLMKVTITFSSDSSTVVTTDSLFTVKSFQSFVFNCACLTI